jgi:hypothetical protein
MVKYGIELNHKANPTEKDHSDKAIRMTDTITVYRKTPPNKQTLQTMLCQNSRETRASSDLWVNIASKTVR